MADRYRCSIKQRKRKRQWKRRNYLIRRGIRALKSNLRRKLWINSIRKQQHNELLTRKSKGFLKPKKPQKFIKIDAPSEFSAINNPEEVLEYFAKSRDLLAKRNQINLDVAKIKSLTPDAIALLIACVKDEINFTHGLNVIGNEPEDSDLKEIFIESGFYDHVKTPYRKSRKQNHLLLHKVTNYKVENEIARHVCQMAVEHTFKSKERFRPIYEILIECMANTNNHASPRGSKYNWWIFLYKDPKTQVSIFSFLDLGVGIFNSLSVQNFLRKATTALNITDNIDLLDDLFAGKISSRTDRSERGKGIPLIYSHSRDPLIKNFVIISNDVYTNLSTGYRKKLGHSLDGTLLYWELHPKPSSDENS